MKKFIVILAMLIGTQLVSAQFDPPPVAPSTPVGISTNFVFYGSGSDGLGLVTNTIVLVNGSITLISASDVVLSPVTLSSILITGAAELDESIQSQYTLTGTYSDTSEANLTTLATWSEDNTNTTITVNGGLLTVGDMIDTQSVDVVASYGGFQNTKPVTLNGIPPDPPVAASFDLVFPNIDTSSVPSVSLDGFAAFDPPVTNVAPHVDAPEIAEWTRTSDAGDTMALTAEGIDGTGVHFALYGTNINAGLIQRIDGQTCALTIPETMPEDGFSLMWPRNANGFGYPVGINQTELWWMDDYVITGDVFRVYGRNLTLGSADSYLYIEELDTWLTNSVSNPYMMEFVLPDTAVAGNYTVYAHNGQGREYGWSEPLTMEVWDGWQFTDSGAMFFNAVTDIGLDNTGATDCRPALHAYFETTARNQIWPTIYFPAGTYLLGGEGKTLNMYAPASEALRILGDGTNSVFKITTAGNASECWKLNVDVVFQDVKIDMWGDGTSDYGDSIYLVSNCNNALFDNVLFSCENLNTFSGRTYVRVNSPRARVKFFESTLFVDRQILCDVVDGLDGYTFENCEFISLKDGDASVSGNASHLAIINCTKRALDVSDTSDGAGWGKGRWMVSGVNMASDNYYIGGNTSTNGHPRGSTPNYFGKPTSLDAPVDFDADYYTQRVYFSDLSSMTIDDIAVTHVIVEYQPDTWSLYGAYPVINFAKANNYVDLKYYKYEYGKDWALVPGATNYTFGIQDRNDSNGGEHFMKEGGVSEYRGAVSTATSNTVTFTDISSHITSAGGGRSAVIVSGRGFGQSRFLSDITGEIITLRDNWRVIPDNTSVIVIGQFASNWAIYDNNLHSDVSQFFGATVGVTGVQFSSGGGGHSVVVENNVFNGQENGLALDMGDYSGGYGYSMTEQVVSPWYFGRVESNMYIGCKYDFLEGSISYPNGNSNDYFAEDTLMLGLVFRGNVSQGSRSSVFTSKLLNQFYDTSKNALNMSIFDNNTATNFTGLSYAVKSRENDIWIGNIFHGTGADSGLVLTNQSTVLQGNAYNGFTSNYTGILPGGVLEVPIRVFWTNNVEQTCWIFNSGTDSISWTNSLGGIGSVEAESSGSFNFIAETPTNFTVYSGAQIISVEVAE